MGHVTWVTILFGSIPEAFFILFVASRCIGHKSELHKIFIMSIIEGIMFYIYMNYLSLHIDIHSLVVTLILTILFCFFLKIDIKNSFIAITFGTTISFLIQYFNLMIIYIVGLRYDVLSKHEILRIIYFCPSLIIFAIIGILVYKKDIFIFRIYDSNNVINNKMISNIFIIINIAMMMTFSIYSYIFDEKIEDYHKKIMLFIVALILAMLFFIVVIMFRLIENNIKKNYEDMLIKRNLDNMKKNINILKKQRHDYLRHMQIIYSLIDSNKFKEASEYIDNLTEHINNEGVFIDTGNIFLNSVISLKQEQSKHKQIEFKINIKSRIGELKIPNFEICNILSNVIDNAFDSLDEIEQNNKYVELTVYVDELCYIFKIKNNGQKITSIDRIFEEGFSTKKGKDRGIGLYIVKQTVEKYKSSIFVESNEDITEFSIIIPKY